MQKLSDACNLLLGKMTFHGRCLQCNAQEGQSGERTFNFLSRVSGIPKLEHTFWVVLKFCWQMLDIGESSVKKSSR